MRVIFNLLSYIFICSLFGHKIKYTWISKRSRVEYAVCQRCEKILYKINKNLFKEIT